MYCIYTFDHVCVNSVFLPSLLQGDNMSEAGHANSEEYCASGSSFYHLYCIKDTHHVIVEKGFYVVHA